MTSDLPDPRTVIRVHDRIEDEYDLTHTGAAVAAPEIKLRTLLEEVDEYEGVYQRAAALFRRLLPN